MASAAGTRIALFTSEPLATAHTTGSSRSARTPLTCCAFSARSSPSTPAVFLAATLVRTETSSSRVLMSSSRASRLVAMEEGRVGAGHYHGTMKDEGANAPVYQAVLLPS